MDDSRAETASPKAGLVPPYLIVLLVAGLLGVFLMHRASGLWHEASQAQSFPAEIRRHLVFAPLFNLGLLGVLAAATLGELAAFVFRLLRKAPAGRAVMPLVVALAVLGIFVAGHALVNPWVTDLLRAARSAMG